MDASVCVLADLGGIAMRSHSHEIETLVPGSLIEISRFDDSGLSSLFTIHGYSPEGVNLEELRGELQDFVTTVPKYSIPRDELREWSEIKGRLSEIIRRPRWNFDARFVETYASMLTEELHATIVGRALSPPRRHILGFITNSLHAFHPAISAFKRLGIQLAELQSLPMWLATKMKAYDRAKHHYVRNVISSDQSIERWIAVGVTFAVLIALQAPTLAAATPLGSQVFVAALNGGRLSRAALRRGLHRFE